MSTGIIFNVQRYSLHDGPGIRTTVFLKGCPARCWWCHNPESHTATPQTAWSQNRCISCDACLLACHDGLQPREACRACGDCAEACPTGARELLGAETTVDQVLQNILKDRMFFEESGGGVTFSGGEPLCQPAFLKALLTACRSHDIHTAVDTAALCPPETLIEIAPLVDLFLFDLKCADDALHQKGTGLGNARVLDNLAQLGRVHRNIWIRIPVVPGFNDTEEEMAALADHAAQAAGVRQVWLLPYHGSWAAKPARLGAEPPAEALAARTPSPQTMEDFARLFTARGLDTQIGGGA
ncbi:glycyl-radical enzyme activating protein [Geomonas anaerohicana]|uniref:Glycyl-radical enzyme activating protein n=1 Tax=Geomonas anaerohicana TaxID=2798583 RepID=A0ABS0YFP3_9BACT|nr:glycyl-radical enzyme activating protein [Geomonas anaerohicana]MBJ6751098.1 glycyl-radical enzyme activating protein [Geomonas anaerohicana]